MRCGGHTFTRQINDTRHLNPRHGENLMHRCGSHERSIATCIDGPIAPGVYIDICPNCCGIFVCAVRSVEIEKVLPGFVAAAVRWAEGDA